MYIFTLNKHFFIDLNDMKKKVEFDTKNHIKNDEFNDSYLLRKYNNIYLADKNINNDSSNSDHMIYLKN